MNKQYIKFLVINIIIIFAIMGFAMVKRSGKNQIEDVNKFPVYESYEYFDHNADVPSANVLPNETLIETTEEDKIVVCEESENNKAFSKDEAYLLAKIAMAEAEDSSIDTKVLVILTVLNRVKSDEFPDTIKEVIFHVNKSGVYQFTPIQNGRWNKVEPNDECWKAVDVVSQLDYDISEGALYFEACSNKDNWHSRNLKFIRQSDDTRFYK